MTPDDLLAGLAGTLDQFADLTALGRSPLPRRQRLPHDAITVIGVDYSGHGYEPLFAGGAVE